MRIGLLQQRHFETELGAKAFALLQRSEGHCVFGPIRAKAPGRAHDGSLIKPMELNEVWLVEWKERRL